MCWVVTNKKLLLSHRWVFHHDFDLRNPLCFTCYWAPLCKRESEEDSQMQRNTILCFFTRWKQCGVKISSSLEYPSVHAGHIGGCQDSSAAIVLPFVFPTERSTDAFELTGQRCKRKLHLWGSPPVTFFSAGHDKFYFIVWDLEKSSLCEKPWVNTNEVWREVQMVGNKKYKKESKVAWSLFLFKRPNNLGVFVTPIVLLLPHCMVPHPPAVVSKREEAVSSAISMAGNNLARYM